MASESFADRAQAYENSFFRNQDAAAVEKLRAVFAANRTKEELSRASGITNPEVLDRLTKLSVSGELFTAFRLFPLVEIAWADGALDPAEANAVVGAATNLGLPRDGMAIARLKEWLAQGPTQDGRAAWRMLAAELRQSLTPAELTAFRESLLKNAREVAEASGGVLGVLLRVSSDEHKVIKDIAKALTN